MEETSTQQE